MIFDSLSSEFDNALLQIAGNNSDDKKAYESFKDFKERLLARLEEDYEKMKIVLEGYYRKLLREATVIEKGNKNSFMQKEASIVNLTNEHHEKLKRLREVYEFTENKIEEGFMRVFKHFNFATDSVQDSLYESTAYALMNRY